MEKLSVIIHPELGEVRSFMIKGEFWLIAKDVCDILGIANSRDAISRLDGDEKGVATTDTLGGKQEIATINESGMYNLIFQSRKPEAKRFRKWVTGEVLPAIRRQGFYVNPTCQLSFKEKKRLTKIMVQEVRKHIIAEDVRRCARKFGVDELYVEDILRERSVNNNIMCDLQDRAKSNRDRFREAYSVSEMKGVIDVLSGK